MKARVTQRDVARAAGVSHAAVSLALRDSPSLPLATRQHIKEIADKIGYTPDPMLSGLAAYRLSQRPASYHSNLGWIINRPATSRLDYAGGDLSEYYAGASSRAKEMGYNLEAIRMAEIDYNPRRLEQILVAKGITGILIPPRHLAGGELYLDFSKFSAVRIGYSYRYPLLHTVVNAQFHTVYKTFQKVVEAGYQRVGFISNYDLDERTAWNLLGGFTAAQRILPPKNRIDPYYPRGVEYEQFDQWITHHKIDCVIGMGLWPAIKKTGVNVGYADLSVLSDEKEISGMYQNADRIGAAAVEYLIAMMHRGETGLPSDPTYLSVQSRWMEGKTLRALK